MIKLINRERTKNNVNRSVVRKMLWEYCNLDQTRGKQMLMIYIRVHGG